MCASGMPVSSEGWEELSSVDSEMETREIRQAGAGESGEWSFCRIFLMVVPKYIFNTPLYPFSSGLNINALCVWYRAISLHFLNRSTFPVVNFIFNLFL